MPIKVVSSVPGGWINLTTSYKHLIMRDKYWILILIQNINQNYYNKILKCDWLSASWFEHQLDCQCTCHACNWTVCVILCTLLRCTLLIRLLGFLAFITTFQNRSALNGQLGRFSNFVIVLITVISNRTLCHPIQSVRFVSITKFSIVIGFSTAYLSRNRHAITWVSS